MGNQYARQSSSKAARAPGAEVSAASATIVQRVVTKMGFLALEPFSEVGTAMELDVEHTRVGLGVNAGPLRPTQVPGTGRLESLPYGAAHPCWYFRDAPLKSRCTFLLSRAQVRSKRASCDSPGGASFTVSPSVRWVRSGRK